MNPPIPVVLCFDVEPDDIEVATGSPPWVGFERLLELATRWRDELGAATGRAVRFDWFLRMDPQIAEAYGSPGWVVDRYGRDLERLRAAGDLIGLHPHALRPTSVPGRWVADHADAGWVDHCIEVSYEAYRQAFGETCRAQRFGDRFMSARALRRAADLGARYDLTIEPGAQPIASLHPGLAATGSLPDMSAAPRLPYRASLEDPIRPGPSLTIGGGPWMIPLTSLDPDPMLAPWRRVARRIRHPGGPRHRPVTLTAAWPAAGFWDLVERELASSTAPYLAFAIRSDTPIVPNLIGPIEAKLEALRARPIVERLVFTTPDAVVADVAIDGFDEPDRRAIA